jgi:hypothetical protein
VIFSELCQSVTAHFAKPGALARVRVMAKAGVQTEGWWKAELMLLLEALRQRGKITGWDREVPTGEGRQRLDFLIQLRDEVLALEIKTALCGEQRDVDWRLPAYVGTGADGWILSDLRKVNAYKLAQPVMPRGLLAVFAYPAPPSEDWDTLIVKLMQKAPQLAISVAHRDEIGQGDLSIGWLELE